MKLAYTILLAEDNKIINEIVTTYLKEAGFAVLSFEDGKLARDMIVSDAQIDLFILDIMLPGVTGLELLKTIREEKRFFETPVMMLTALNDEYTQMISFDGLADDYVTKPFSAKILVKRVMALLRRNGNFTVTVNVLQFGNITVDTDRYQAYENGEKIQLTLREFELLKMFLNNCNKALTRQQLLDLVWGIDFFGDERIVDVHIKNLRKKFKTNIIKTVKGVGYMAETGDDHISHERTGAGRVGEGQNGEKPIKKEQIGDGVL